LKGLLTSSLKTSKRARRQCCSWGGDLLASRPRAPQHFICDMWWWNGSAAYFSL